LTVIPPSLYTAQLSISNEGIWFDGNDTGSKLLILETDKAGYSRGITLKVDERDNWIHMVPLALNEEITFTSITYEGKHEKWLSYNGVYDNHNHD